MKVVITLLILMMVITSGNWDDQYNYEDGDSDYFIFVEMTMMDKIILLMVMVTIHG